MSTKITNPVFINPILKFAVRSAKELIAKSHVCHDWRDAIEYYSTNICANFSLIDKFDALYFAIVNRQYQCLNLFLKNGINPNTKNELTGKTMLHYAVSIKDTHSAALLLNAGADPNSTTTHGETPLYSAIHNRALDCVNLLLTNGAKVNIKNVFENSPLHIATIMLSNQNSDQRIIDIISLLLENNADPNFVDSECRTALFLAIMRGCRRAVNLFLKKRFFLPPREFITIDSAILRLCWGEYDHHICKRAQCVALLRNAIKLETSSLEKNEN